MAQSVLQSEFPGERFALGRQPCILEVAASVFGRSAPEECKLAKKCPRILREH